MRSLSIVLLIGMLLTITFSCIATAEAFTVGEMVIFGTYEQDNDLSNGKEPIAWYIIKKEFDEYQLISVHVLEYLPFNSKANSAAWNKCSLRKWLNNDFYNQAFSRDEKKAIKQKKIVSDNNYSKLTTTDRVFVANTEEASNIYKLGIDVYNASFTAYSKERGQQALTKLSTNSRIDSFFTRWWTRSTEEEKAKLTGSSSVTYFNTDAVWKNYEVGGVRPIITVNLKKGESLFRKIENAPNYLKSRELGIDKESLSFNKGFYHTWKANKEFILFDTDRKVVVRFYRRHNSFNHAPDYGIYTGDLVNGAKVTFTYFKDPVTFKLKSRTSNVLLWISSDDSIMTDYSYIPVEDIISFLNNAK